MAAAVLAPLTGCMSSHEVASAYEVLADDISRMVKAALSADPAALYARLKG
jgi:hypothetical protein